MKIIFLIAMMISLPVFSGAIPASFVCENKCSTPGLNQIMFGDDGTFKVIASLTPKPKVFAEGHYKVVSDSVFLNSEDSKITFSIVKSKIDFPEKSLDAYRLVWISGSTTYFKEGILFVETNPAVWGINE